MPRFDAAIRQVVPYLHRYGYFAIFGAIFLEGVGIPTPGVTILVAASVAAAAGAMSWPLVVATGLVAAVLGFNSGYWLGVLVGQQLLQRLPFFSRERFLKLHRLFKRWGTAVIVLAPFVDGLRQVNAYAAGIAEMPWYRFGAANFVGAAMWVGAWSSLAYEASLHARLLYHVLHVGNVWWYVGGGLALAAALVYLLWHRRRHKDANA